MEFRINYVVDSKNEKSDAIKNPRGGLVIKVRYFDRLKLEWESYFPDSKIPDLDFNEFLSENRRLIIGFNIFHYLTVAKEIRENYMFLKSNQEENGNSNSKNTLKNPRGGLVLKVDNFDNLKIIWKNLNQPKKYPIFN